MKSISAAPVRRLLVLLGLGLLAGCSNPQEDVRITLCKGMVVSELGGADAVDWKKSTAEPRGYDHAVVRLEYSNAGKSGQAACYYAYDAPEENAMTQANPLSAYATYPYKMTLNGQDLSKAGIAQAVKNAMLMQGAEFAEQIKKTGGEITDRVKKTFE